MSLRCILDGKNKSDAKINESIGFWDRLKSNLSCYCIRTVNELNNGIFHMKNAGNFLIKNEAKYFPFTQQNISNDDLNSILNANNKHMTICLNWKASISDNGKFIRNSFGQHFVQIDHLFES